jgi:hypothetical protein
MKTADRENPNSCDRLCNVPSPWGGRQEAPSLNQAGWKVRKFPAVGEVFFLTFPFIELIKTWPPPLCVSTARTVDKAPTTNLPNIYFVEAEAL